MAKIPRDKLERIIEKEAPRQKIAEGRPAERDAPRTRAPAQGGTPDLATLKRRYGKRGPGATDAPRGGAKAARPVPKAEDDEVVLLQSKEPRDPVSRGSRPKAVVVSGKDGRIIGRQG
mgnify:CR=1 FL=1